MRHGHAVDLVAAETQSDLDFDSPSVIEGVTVHRFLRPLFPAWHPLRLTRPIALYVRAIEKVLSQRNFNVIHFHSIFTGEAVRRALQSFASRPATVYTVHSPVAQEQELTWSQQGAIGVVNKICGLPIVRSMERKLIRMSDATHVLSRFTAEELGTEHPRLAKDYHVIPHFVYQDWKRDYSQRDARGQLEWPAEAKILFTVRQLRYRYGIDDAIRAVAPLARAGRCILNIAGDGPDREKLQRLITAESLGEQVRLLGAVSDEMLKLAYQAADLFILPTRHLECFGLISLEAMSYGLPVLGTRVGAIPEVLSPILPGFLSPPNDPAALGGLIQAFLDGCLNGPSQDAIARYAHDTYSETSVLDRYERMLEQAIASKRFPPAGQGT